MNRRLKRALSVWPLVIGLAALLVVGLAIAFTIGSATAPGAIGPPVETGQMTPSPVVVESEATYAAYHLGGENPLPRAPKDPARAPAPPTTEPVPFPTGIFPGGEGAFYSRDVVIQNRWQAIVGGEPIQVFAGSVYADDQQGVVIVFGQSPAGRYFTPTKAGPVYIVEELGLRLMLASADGLILYFDVPGRQFVASLEATVAPAPPATTAAPESYPALTQTAAPYP